jgi:hypothetical protein
MRSQFSTGGIVGAPRAVAKRAYRGLVGERPVDPVRAWHGTAIEGQPALRMLHLGDCGVRRMDLAHDLLGEPGYPRAAARQLLRRGVRLEFSHYFCVGFEDLPDLELLCERTHVSEAPDVLLVQIGGAYTRKVMLPDEPRIHQLRDELARCAPRLVLPFYRVLRPCLLRFGRHSTRYPGVANLEQLLGGVRRAWPSTRVVLMMPFQRSPGYPTGEPIAARIEADLRALAERADVCLLDANDVLGRDPALRCVTGYNLNGLGSQLVGIRLADWLGGRLDAAAADSGAGSRLRA